MPVSDPFLGCLNILLSHYGKKVPSATLMAGLPLNNGRLNAALLPRAAARAGVELKRTTRSVTNLNPHVLPVVALKQAGQPFVLLSHDETKGWQVAEPGSSPRWVTTGELNTLYGGELFLARQSSAFELGSELFSTGGSWFWGTLKQFKKIYIQAVLAAVMVNLLALVIPLFIMNVYDRVVPNAAFSTLWVLTLGVVMALVFDFLLRQLRSYFLDVAGRGADIMLSSQLFQKTMNLRLGALGRSAGTYANQLREFETLREFFTSATLTTLVDLPFVLLFILFIALFAGPVALVPLLAIPLILGMSFVVQVPLKGIIAHAAKDMDAKHAHLVETVQGLETVKLLNAQSHMQAHWEYLAGVMARLGLRSRFLSMLGVNFSAFVQQLVTVLVVVVGVYQVDAGAMSVGALVAAIILAGRTMAPVSQAVGLYVRFQQAKTALNNLNQIMQGEEEKTAGKKLVALGALKGEVALKNVSFSYPGAVMESLHGVNLHIKPGERVAIVGKTGSGKTTLTKLMQALYLPTAGQVLVDGIEVRQFDPVELRSQMGAVSQQVMLFSGTLRDNLQLAKPGVDDNEIMDALRMVGLEDLVRRHPQGLDVSVGEGGRNLSGGQRQAVCVARALLNDPKLVIMDEPTSEMDNGTEATLTTKLGDWLQGRTLVLVTHRMSLLNLVDRMIVMDNGQVMADGPKEEVIAKLQGSDVPAARPKAAAAKTKAAPKAKTKAKSGAQKTAKTSAKKEKKA